MADDEVSLTEFELTPTIRFDAGDVASDLGALATLDLIEELDSELDSWEATILLSRQFSRAAAAAPPDLLGMTDEELELRIRKESGEEAA